MTKRLTCMLVALASGHVAQADTLGRLFFTPEQRAQLEYRQAHGIADNSHSGFTLNGIVQKHGGARTVWINGMARDANGDDTPDTASMSVPGKTQTVRIKVGQKVSLEAPGGE